MQNETMMKNFDWYVANYRDLCKKYGDCFLAIKNCNVIGVYNTFSDAVEQTLKTEEVGTFNIQECNGEESAYTCWISSMNFK